jgi:hypothetical protein
MRKLIATPFGRIAALVTVLALCLLGAQAATVTATARTGATTAGRPVAHTHAGVLTSRIVGTTSNGRQVTGSFVPLHFSKRSGKVFVRGLVQGVVHNGNGSTSTFSQLRTLRVRSINGTPARAGRLAAAQRATCGILHLVLGPLHLNLLGLHVDLNRVVLNITAHSGSGNLLGNLLCAVAHLLDNNSSLQGLLTRLTNLLNQILGNLRLG